MYYARGAGNEDDIVGRLEALRRRAPPGGAPGGAPGGGKAPKPSPVKPPEDDERRRRLYRIVGLVVIAVIVLGIFFIGYTKIIKPMKQKEVKVKVEEEKVSQALIQGKEIVRGRIRDAFSGLPVEFKKEEAVLYEQVEKAKSIEDLKAIDYKAAADRAWRDYIRSKVDEMVKMAGEDKIVLKAGNQSFKGYREIMAAISTFKYPVLKTAYVEEIRSIYLPIRMPREKAAGGFLMPGDYINIYYTDGENTTVIAKDARVVAYLRATATISLSESENRIVSGQGGEAKGEGSISTGGVSSLTGPISIGVRQSSSSTTYTVNIEEVAKAAAASKLDEKYIKNVLSNYGIKLSQIEINTQVGNFDEEYLLLLEMSEDEAMTLISKASTDTGRENLQIALSKPSSWMER